MTLENTTVLENIIKSAIVVLSLVVTYLIIKSILNHRASKLKRGKRLTYVRLFRSVSKYIFIIAGILCVLKINGVNTASILASLGIASLVAGLALQDALKDIIMGFNILADNYFTAGDVINLNGSMCKVIEVGFKATKVKNLDNENIEMIANRNISSSSVISHWNCVNVPLPYDLSLESSEAIMTSIADKIKKIPEVESAEYKGIQDFADSAIVYAIFIMVRPEFKYPTKRAARRIIKQELDAAKISIPYQTITISK